MVNVAPEPMPTIADIGLPDDANPTSPPRPSIIPYYSKEGVNKNEEKMHHATGIVRQKSYIIVFG